MNYINYDSKTKGSRKSINPGKSSAVHYESNGKRKESGGIFFIKLKSNITRKAWNESAPLSGGSSAVDDTPITLQ